MYIFSIVSTIYICYLLSFIPQIYRDGISRKSLDELEEEDRIENEFDFLDSKSNNELITE